MKTIIKYARKCDITGEGMNEGYCIGDGLMYIKYEKDMIKHLREMDFCFEDEEGNPIDVNSFSDSELMEWSYNDEYHYWTDWYETLEEEDEWYTEEGSLITNIKEYETVVLGETEINVSGEKVNVKVIRNSSGNLEVLGLSEIFPDGICTEGYNEEVRFSKY